MNHTDLQKLGGGVEYTAPICKFVELDTNATICQGSNGDGTYSIDDWTTDDSGLEF